jgi:hypothetical protein
MKLIRKGMMMIRFLLYLLFFYLLFRLIRRLFTSANTEGGRRSSPPQEDSPKKRNHPDINEAEIEDATFEEIEHENDGTQAGRVRDPHTGES